MTGIDTNVLVRFLVGDEPDQEARAAAFLTRASAGGEGLFVPQIVVCELVWVLETAYGYGRKAIWPVLEQILRTRQFTFQDKDLLWQALADYRDGKGDFADYLIGHISRAAGCARGGPGRIRRHFRQR